MSKKPLRILTNRFEKPSGSWEAIEIDDLGFMRWLGEDTTFQLLGEIACFSFPVDLEFVE